jgi:hypothetical protein
MNKIAQQWMPGQDFAPPSAPNAPAAPAAGAAPPPATTATPPWGAMPAAPAPVATPAPQAGVAAKSPSTSAKHPAKAVSHNVDGIIELKRAIEKLTTIIGAHKDQLDLDHSLTALNPPREVSTDPMHFSGKDLTPSSFDDAAQHSANLGKTDKNNKRQYASAWDNNTTVALIGVCSLLEVTGAKMKDSNISTFAKNLKAFAEKIDTKASNIMDVARSIANNLDAASIKISAFVKTLPTALTADERKVMRSNTDFQLDIPAAFYEEDGAEASNAKVPVKMTDLRSPALFSTWLRGSSIQIVNENDGTKHPAADLPDGPSIVLKFIDSLLG